MSTLNTLVLRLEGPLQSWGAGSRFVFRDTAPHPTKSGIVGLLCCAMGLSRQAAGTIIPRLAALRLGVRLDRPGHRVSDYHTVGAGIGNLSAEGRLKRTATTGEIETFVTRRQYLADASFVAVLQGDAALIMAAASALQDPVWPVYLGRKACAPACPVFALHGSFETLEAVLTEIPLAERSSRSQQQEVVLDIPVGERIPPDAVWISDVPVSFDPPVHQSRPVVWRRITPASLVPEVSTTDVQDRPQGGYGTSQWRNVRAERLKQDSSLCLFCKAPATDVHHVSYEYRGMEAPEELRSLCSLCHDAVTMLEYGLNLGITRIDPCDSIWREQISSTRARILAERNLTVRATRLRGEA